MKICEKNQINEQRALVCGAARRVFLEPRKTLRVVWRAQQQVAAIYHVYFGGSLFLCGAARVGVRRLARSCSLSCGGKRVQVSRRTRGAVNLIIPSCFISLLTLRR